MSLKEKLARRFRFPHTPHVPHCHKNVLIRQIREAVAEDSRKDIIERLLKGRQERVRKGP